MIQNKLLHLTDIDKNMKLPVSDTNFRISHAIKLYFRNIFI